MEDYETRETLAQLAASDLHTCEDFSGFGNAAEEYVNKYIRSILDVDDLLKTERIRQELRVNDLLRRKGRILKIPSTPGTSGVPPQVRTTKSMVNMTNLMSPSVGRAEEDEYFNPMYSNTINESLTDVNVEQERFMDGSGKEAGGK